ncbi:MAG: hypothetical protein HPY76_00510 [Anaerolineae bacterium]|nr:hypothetical protein [Anaerolineae bacterium]
MKRNSIPLEWVAALLVVGVVAAIVILLMLVLHPSEPTGALPASPTEAATTVSQTPSPPTPQPTATSTPTSVPLTAIPSPAPSETPTVPESFYITDILGHRQYFSIGCEASAAVDWAEYFGFTINEFEYQHKLPLSDNPDLGFVGNVNSPWGQVPPYAYGVHAYPIANLLRDYGLRATGVKGWTLEQVKYELAQGQPVIAWVIGNMVGGVPYEYTDQNGGKVIVAAYEHVVILTGYDADSIRYLNNGRFYDIPNEYFLNSWGILGNMALYWED